MCPAWLLLAGAAPELRGERRLAAREPLENLLHVVDRCEGVLTLGAGPQLSGRLGTAQEQHGEHGELGSVEPECLPQEVGVLVDTAALAGRAHELSLPQRDQRACHVVLVVVNDRVAAGALVAGQQQPVRRERVRIGRRRLLLGEAPEDTDLLRRQLQGGWPVDDTEEYYEAFGAGPGRVAR